MRVCLFFVALLFNFALAGFSSTIYSAGATGSQVIPNVGFMSYDNGNIICLLDRYSSPATLDCEIQHNVTSPTSVVIAVGGRGTTGPTIFEFTNELSRHIRETFYFTEIVDYPVENQINDFLRGKFYVNIASAVWPNGSIRGQLEAGHRVVARLDSSKTIPTASGTTATGIALGSYSFNGPTKYMSLLVVHDVTNPTSFQLHQGGANQIGVPLYTYPNFVSPIYGSVQLSADEETDLFADLLYLTVTSKANPTGDIRGQLEGIDYIETGSFTAYLTGGNVFPPVETEFRGCAVVSFNCETNVFEYLVMHNIPLATGAALFLGEKDTAGSLFHNLPSGTSPIFGKIVLNMQQVYYLYTESMFFQIYQNDVPVIRGQLGTAFDFFAYLSGTAVLPAISTPAKGCGLFRIVQDETEDNTIESTLIYSISHNINGATFGNFRNAPEGSYGPVVWEVEATAQVVDNAVIDSPWNGAIPLNSRQLNAIYNEQIYFEIPSEQYTTGEIRGQVRRISPCDADAVHIDVGDSTIDVFSYFSLGYTQLSGRIILKSASSTLAASVTLFILCCLTHLFIL